MSDKDFSSTSSSSDESVSDEEFKTLVFPLSSRTSDCMDDSLFSSFTGQDAAKNSTSKDAKNSGSNYLKEIKLSSSLQPGRKIETYLNVYPHLKTNEPRNKLRELSLLKLEEMKSKNKRAQPGFEKQHTLPPYFESRRKRRKEGLKERDKTKGPGWFNMPATEVTEELKNDLTVLQMRGSLDPKHFYKRGNDKICPKYFQVGTIIESPAEFYSARIPKKQRKKTLVDELLDDADYRKYQKKKYTEALKTMQQKKFHASQKKTKVKQTLNIRDAKKKKKHMTNKTKALINRNKTRKTKN